MNKQLLDHIWDQTRQRYGVYLRILDAIPEDRIHTNPVVGMRTPAELAVHISRSMVQGIAEGVARGEVVAGETTEEQVARGLSGKQEVLDFARDCWAKADHAVQATGDTHLDAMVPTPWGMTAPGRALIHAMNEEFLHHRAQLSVFVRVCGAEPPMIWGFAENAPEFRPQK